jgi:hypothetical protein
MLLYAHPQGQTREQLSVLSSNLGGLWYWSGPVTTTATLENAGNVDSEVQASLTATDSFSGKVVYQSAVDLTTLLPETERSLDLSWDDVPAFGIFEIAQTITAPGLAHSLSTTIVVVPLWTVPALIILIALAVVQVWYFRSIKRQQHNQGKHHAAHS